jgi:adenine/guanine/hypoxanthine permease
MLWIGCVVAMVDGRLRRAAVFLFVSAALALFGVIHSVDPRGGLHWPWALDGLARTISLQFVAAYVVLGVLLVLLSLQRQTAAEPEHNV